MNNATLAPMPSPDHQDRDDGEPWRPAQRAHTIFQIAPEAFHRHEGVLLPQGFPDALRVAEFQQRSPASLFRRHAARDIFFDLLAHMKIDLLHQVGIALLAAEDPAPVHCSSSVGPAPSRPLPGQLPGPSHASGWSERSIASSPELSDGKTSPCGCSRLRPNRKKPSRDLPGGEAPGRATPAPLPAHPRKFAQSPWQWCDHEHRRSPASAESHVQGSFQHLAAGFNLLGALDLPTRTSMEGENTPLGLLWEADQRNRDARLGAILGDG